MWSLLGRQANRKNDAQKKKSSASVVCLFTFAQSLCKAESTTAQRNKGVPSRAPSDKFLHVPASEQGVDMFFFPAEIRGSTVAFFFSASVCPPWNVCQCPSFRSLRRAGLIRL